MMQKGLQEKILPIEKTKSSYLHESDEALALTHTHTKQGTQSKLM